MEIRSIEAVLRALNEAHVRYLVVGGLAVVAHGHVRLTADLDIVLDLDQENVKHALEALVPLGYRARAPVPMLDFADPMKRRSWIDEKNMMVFSLLSKEHPLTEIDLFVEHPFDFGKAYQTRVSMEVVPGLPATFVSLDDLVRMKRRAGRAKDLEDIRCLERIARERADD